MKLMIANEKTGEVVSTDCTAGLKQIRGVIRTWMKDGLKMHQFSVLDYGHNLELWAYIRDYAWERQINTCEVCDHVQTNGDLYWGEDSEGVTIIVMCKDHAACEKRVDKLIKELEMEDDNFYMHS